MNETSPDPIPWYRTRKFWAVVYGLMLLWSILFYLTTFPHGRAVSETIQHVLNASGGFLFLYISERISSTYGITIALITYLSFITGSVYVTLKAPTTKLLYPSMLTAQFLISSYLIIQIISGLN